jgi:hypothetical protein
MSPEQPWYRFTFPTCPAFTDKGHDFFRTIIERGNLDILETRDLELFDPDWVNNLCVATDNEITSAMLFFRPAHWQEATAHIDFNTNVMKQTGVITTIPAAVNLIYDGALDDSEMVWYYAPEIKDSDVKWTAADTAYLEYLSEDLIEMSRCCMGNYVTLVRTDVPHNIIMQKRSRLCVSLRLRWTGWQDPTWPGIIEQCKNHLTI